ncbi:MAG: YjbQ family protein [Candidatus Diapherotrites archaeon]|uniref:YjbQ family protein n=1 Tax=Candidatus Iainarchaeum sp. TaxID=3101447 RepID=A0A7K4BZJ4_9ARCH|nr:YjbQ family protein [Candidatus Diapherotrites archaeon]
MIEIKIKTKKRNELIDITNQIKKIVSKTKTITGICVIYTPHTTAGIIINENADPNVETDLINALEKIVPKINYLHAEGNSDAHLKSTIVGKEKTLIIENKQLVLGTWDGIYFFEFDGPRERKIIVKIIKEK